MERNVTQADFMAQSPVGRILVKSHDMAWPQTDQFFIRSLLPEEEKVMTDAVQRLNLQA